jgi:hypothetical protein
MMCEYHSDMPIFFIITKGVRFINSNKGLMLFLHLKFHENRLHWRYLYLHKFVVKTSILIADV